MGEFHKLLTYENVGLAEKNSDRESPIDAVKAAVCQNINLLVNRDEEEFSKFLQTFVQDVWKQLVQVTTSSNQVPPASLLRTAWEVGSMSHAAGMTLAVCRTSWP